MKALTSAVLFDLDGTIIDSAPDLAGAANEMRRVRGLPDASYDRLRAMVGSGARGLVGEAFGVAPGDDRQRARSCRRGQRNAPRAWLA